MLFSPHWPVPTGKIERWGFCRPECRDRKDPFMFTNLNLLTDRECNALFRQVSSFSAIWVYWYCKCPSIEFGERWPSLELVFQWKIWALCWKEKWIPKKFFVLPKIKKKILSIWKRKRRRQETGLVGGLSANKICLQNVKNETKKWD